MLAGFFAMLAAIMLGAFCFIVVLAGKVSDTNEQIKDLTFRYEKVKGEKSVLLREKTILSASAANKAQILEIMSEELRYIEELLGLDASPDTPRHERIAAAGKSALEKRMMLDSIPSGYPVESRFVTSGFGTRMHPVHGNQSFHGGVDLRSPRGEPVYATADGIVEWAALHRESGLGKMVILVHNYGFASTFAHLDEIKVSEGQFVKKGDVIGLVGSTGVSTAPHLHYEVRYLKCRLNPKPFMDWSVQSYDDVFEKVDNIQWPAIVEAVRRNTEKPAIAWARGPQKVSWSAISH